MSSLHEEAALGELSLAEWLAQAETIRVKSQSDITHKHIPSASELVNEAREERDADILFGNVSLENSD